MTENLKLQRRLLTPLLLKKVPPLPTDDERIVYPKYMNPFSWLFFWWLHPLMRTGYKRMLTPQDMYKLHDDIKVERMAAKFSANLVQAIGKARANHLKKKLKERGTSNQEAVDLDEDLDDFEPPRFIVIWAIFHTFGLEFGLACLYLTLANTALTCTPLLSKKLINYVEYRSLGLESRVGPGVGYALGCSLLVLVVGVFVNHAFHNSMLAGAKVKAVLTKCLLEKSFKLSAKSRHKFPTSKITSIMGTDLARIDFAMGFQPYLFTFPVPIAIAIGILCNNIGAAAMVGVGVVFVYLFLMVAITKKLFAFRKSANKYTDNRVNYIKEVLTNLKIIKFYSWEEPYNDLITYNRTKEMEIIYKMQVARNVITSVAMCLTLFASLSSFLVVYATQGSTKNPASIFASLSLFNALSQQVFILPIALATGSDAIVGVIRSGAFLASSEAEVRSLEPPANSEIEKEMIGKNLAIKTENASFKWESFDNSNEDENAEKDGEVTPKESPEHSEKGIPIDKTNTSDTSSRTLEATIFNGLHDLNLEIKKGEFVAITGLIGSGKTSLLNGLAGFMKCTEGEAYTAGSVLLCSNPWIQNTTVKDNILFGSELDEQKYKDVIYSCSLESDLEILPAGDQTEIGERGITLSGGQKARINLARAVYAGKDIILLDDVLSAVDARVGKHIMENCILGLLKTKTRVLATHQLSLIGSADRIIFLNGDGTIDCGTFDELKLRNPGFEHLMAFSSQQKEKEEEDEEDDIEVLEDGDNADAVSDREFIQRQLSRKSTVVDEEAEHYNYTVNEKEDGRLMSDERKAENGISFQVYKNYVKFGSGIFKHYTIVPLIVILTIIATFCQLFTNTWLSFWTEFKFDGKSNGFYIGFYVMFTILSLVFLTLEFVTVAYMANKSAVALTLKAIRRVIRAPMSFMDTTPMGRILNRFTKDTDVLDNEISNQMRMLIFLFANIVGVLILCIVYLPWFAIAVPFLVFIFVAIGNFYQGSAREIKRLEATQRSFVYTNFNETLVGMDTIKAYKAEHRFMSTNDRHIDNMNEAYYFTISNQRWLAIHLDLIATAFALIISLLCVFRVFLISAASVGLLLSYVLQIAGQLSMLIRMYTQVENEMNSAERLCEYVNDLPQEAPYLISETTPPESWPDQGVVRFENASLSYRPGLPLVLKKLNFDSKPAEKIGICGRTGAGKSSIMAALYRLSELSGGKIEIDGIDISTLGLHNLRSKMSIIPQDPILFRGTIRKNLDPFGTSTDDKLWDALSRAGLIEQSKLSLVKAQDLDSENLHKFHLERTVEDEGGNFSLGERQLISFARALIRESKILILDEATSSVDYETDSKIQETIVREFSHCTILCIAHRLRTIVNYDRILVLDKGEVKEFDTPLNLFNLKGSIFQQMCARSGIVAEDFE